MSTARKTSMPFNPYEAPQYAEVKKPRISDRKLLELAFHSSDKQISALVVCILFFRMEKRKLLNKKKRINGDLSVINYEINHLLEKL